MEDRSCARIDIASVSIIGMGALGILYGRALTQGMPRGAVRFIADKARIERYRAAGVYCNGERMDFCFVEPGLSSEANEATAEAHEATTAETYEATAMNGNNHAGCADLLLVAVKAPALERAIQDARAQVGPQTTIMPLMNGISPSRILAEAFGADKVLPCVAQGMDAVREGSRLTYTHMGILRFGGPEDGDKDRVEAVSRLFDRCGIAYEVCSDMRRVLWSKFMLNVGVNQAAMLFGVNYGGVQAEGQPRELMLAAMREVIPLAAKEGVRLTEEDVSYWMGVLDNLAPDGKPSMLQDALARRPSEVDLFAGEVRRLGVRHGIPTPVNDRIYASIRAIEEGYAHT